DAFLIAVEEQARARLQRLSALKRITPVDMILAHSKIGFYLNRRKRTQPENRQELNGYIANSTVYVTSINENGSIETKPTISSPQIPTKIPSSQTSTPNGIEKAIAVEVKVEPEKHEKDLSEKGCKIKVDSVDGEVISDKDPYSVAREHLSNGRCEKLIGEPDYKIRATAVVENNKLGPGDK
ncbi:LOW QUALITY PROTEIN: hypothetical protein MSG28_004470, partial [Choristoneura fumiferana]